VTDPTPTLAERTTLRVGGPSDAWVAATTEDQLVEAVRSCDREGTPVLLVGGGSNLLVADEGFRGTVVEVATRGLEAQDHGDRVVVRLAAGEPWDDIVSRAVARGWAGIEALSGIPGRVGATPVQNVGAYGAEIADVLVGVRALDRAAGEVTDLSAEDCAFGYRTSVFKRHPGRWVVLQVTLELATDGDGTVRYAELARALGVATGERAPVGAIRGAVLGLRSRKGMVLSADDPDTWSAGSFFTNPVLDEAAAAVLPAQCPRYPAADGVKVSAAWLIEHAGVERGYALPGSQAAISTKHTLALTNRGGATAAEVVDLARAVRAAVLDRFAIELAPEPVLVGLTL
jgi:UDP-N-acetylmuramate dehydrogenase